MDTAELFQDPRIMFSEFGNNTARFVPMTRETYARSIFFDRRIETAGPQGVQCPLNVLVQHLNQSGFKAPRLRFIHHFAHSGSTLLARALEHSSNLIIREPMHLRQVGVWAGAGASHSIAPELAPFLSLSLAMLGKRFTPDSTVIVKGNVPISLVAEAIAEMDPGQPGILLYFPLEEYCAAVLRTVGHQGWVNRVTADIKLDRDPAVGDINALTVGERAAALWFSMIKRFERMLEKHPEMRSLDGDQLFERPAETIAAASDLLEAGLSAQDAEAVAGSELFSSYSKNPAKPFDNEARLKVRSEAKMALANELQAARRWVEQRAAREGLPVSLPRPLIGDAPNLLR